jgi:hypothetical protein
MIPNIDRRLKKIESQLHLDEHDFSQWSDDDLEEHIICELERMISAAGSLEAVADAYRAEGMHADAEMITRDYLYDPTSKIVSRKSAPED